MGMPELVVIHPVAAGTPGCHKVTSSGSMTVTALFTTLWGPKSLVWVFSFIRSGVA